MTGERAEMGEMKWTGIVAFLDEPMEDRRMLSGRDWRVDDGAAVVWLDGHDSTVVGRVAGVGSWVQWTEDGWVLRCSLAIDLDALYAAGGDVPEALYPEAEVSCTSMVGMAMYGPGVVRRIVLGKALAWSKLQPVIPAASKVTDPSTPGQETGTDGGITAAEDPSKLTAANGWCAPGDLLFPEVSVDRGGVRKPPRVIAANEEVADLWVMVPRTLVDEAKKLGAPSDRARRNLLYLIAARATELTVAEDAAEELVMRPYACADCTFVTVVPDGPPNTAAHDAMLNELAEHRRTHPIMLGRRWLKPEPDATTYEKVDDPPAAEVRQRLRDLFAAGVVHVKQPNEALTNEFGKLDFARMQCRYCKWVPKLVSGLSMAEADQARYDAVGRHEMTCWYRPDRKRTDPQVPVGPVFSPDEDMRGSWFLVPRAVIAEADSRLAGYQQKQGGVLSADQKLLWKVVDECRQMTDVPPEKLVARHDLMGKMKDQMLSVGELFVQLIDELGQDWTEKTDGTG
jgi:hypothetical protein